MLIDKMLNATGMSHIEQGLSDLWNENYSTGAKNVATGLSRLGLIGAGAVGVALLARNVSLPIFVAAIEPPVCQPQDFFNLSQKIFHNCIAREGLAEFRANYHALDLLCVQQERSLAAISKAGEGEIWAQCLWHHCVNALKAENLKQIP